MLKFSAKTEIIEADDFVTAVLEVCRAEKARRVGLLLDPRLAERAEVQRLAPALEAAGVMLNRQVGPGTEPTTDMVDAMAAHFHQEPPDLLVGIGGGSTLDLAKAVSVMAVCDGPVSDYHGTGKPLLRGIKKVMVPTTAGTGSEVTPGAVLVNTKTAFKRALGGPLVCPDYAVLDARLTLSMPEAVTVATGMDALAHAVESYTARCANAVTRMYSLQAFSMVVNNLPRVIAEPANLEYRRRVLLGSCLAGYAIFNSNTGAAHAMAYPMGIYHHVPHGVAVALLLPHVVAMNVARGCVLYSDLWPLIEGQSGGASPGLQAQSFSEFLLQYPPLQKLNFNLTRYGIDGARVNFMAERGLDLASALGNNPVDFHYEDAVQVLRRLT
jgi:alcohol dehydrogenase class IV